MRSTSIDTYRLPGFLQRRQSIIQTTHSLSWPSVRIQKTSRILSRMFLYVSLSYWTTILRKSCWTRWLLDLTAFTLNSLPAMSRLNYTTLLLICWNLRNPAALYYNLGSQRLISISRSISDIWNFVVGLQVNNLRSAHVSTNLRIPNARADARYWYDFMILIPFEISSQMCNPVELWKQRGRGYCMDLRKLRSGYLVVHGRWSTFIRCITAGDTLCVTRSSWCSRSISNKRTPAEDRKALYRDLYLRRPTNPNSSRVPTVNISPTPDFGPDGE